MFSGMRPVLVAADERVDDRHAEPRRRADHLPRVLVHGRAVLGIGVQVVRVVAEPRDLEPEARRAATGSRRRPRRRASRRRCASRPRSAARRRSRPASRRPRARSKPLSFAERGDLLERPVGERDGQEAELHAGAATRPRRNDRTSSTSTSGLLDGQVVAAVLDGDAPATFGSAASISSPAAGGTTPSRSPATRSTGAAIAAQLRPAGPCPRGRDTSTRRSPGRSRRASPPARRTLPGSAPGTTAPSRSSRPSRRRPPSPRARRDPHGRACPAAPARAGRPARRRRRQPTRLPDGGPHTPKRASRRTSGRRAPGSRARAPRRASADRRRSRRASTGPRRVRCRRFHAGRTSRP